MDTEFRTISLEEAEQLLVKQKRNRPGRVAWVNRLAQMMDDGHWYPETGETIKVSSAGHLLDGQHRLRAMMLHGKPLKFLVVSGIRPEAQEFMDNNKSRTPADDLAMHGYPNASTLASMTRIIMLHESDFLRTGGHKPGKRHNIVVYTPKEVRLFVKARPWLVDYAREALTAASRSQFLFTATHYGALREILGQLDEEKAVWFLERLTLGDGLVKTDPIFLRRRIFQSDKLKRGERRRFHENFALSFKAWNLHLAGARRHTLAVKSNEKWPEPQRPEEVAA